MLTLGWLQTVSRPSTELLRFLLNHPPRTACPPLHSCPCHLKETSSGFPLSRCSAGLLPQNSTVALNGSKNPFPQGPKLPHLCVWQPAERGQEPATSRFPPTLCPAHLCQQGRGRNFAVNPIFAQDKVTVTATTSHFRGLLGFTRPEAS